MRTLEAHDHFCFSKSAGVGQNRQVELNSFIVPSIMILKPNTLDNYYSGSTRIYSLWCQRQHFFSMGTFLLYIFTFKNTHSRRWMSSRNISMEHKVKRPCKLSQAQILKFRHVELVGKKLSNFSAWFRAETWLPSLLLTALINQILAVLEWSFPSKCIYLTSLSECRQVTRPPSWLEQ